MEKTKKIRSHLLAFLIPFIICISVLFFKDILLNIENIYVSDLRLQHVVFLNYLKEVLTGNASMLYSFYAGMGNSMLSTIVFYCLSPINLLLLLIKDIRYAVLFIYIVKVSLSGLTMYILLKSKNHNNSNKLNTLIFSTCYALSAFVINYFFCVFWFDSLYLAPLVMLGIDKIIKTEKINLIYIFSLALAIICNIQMGFGLCIYSVIYYIYSYSIKHEIKNFKKFKQLGLIFAISSLCAGAISSGALFGFILDYGNISSARDISITTSPGVANLGLVIKNLFTVGNLKTDYYNNYEPFIYCGLIVSFFSILYLFNTDIEKRKRTCALGVILIFLISFFTNFINLFWHLSSPVLLNFRYSIYLALFLTMLAYECYVTKTKLLKKDITILTISLFIGFFVILAYSNEVYVIWTFIFLILIFALILLSKNKNKKFEVLLVITVIAEIFTNSYLSIYTASELPFGKYSSYDDLKKVSSYKKFDDNYRVMYNYSYTDYSNDTLLLNKNSSIRYFSSVINGDVIKFFEKNQSTTGNNNYRISAYDSPLIISLMGNKYIYLTKELNNSIYEKIDSHKIKSYNYVIGKMETKDVYLYENPYALSLGYVIEKDAKYDKKIHFVDYQNKLIKSFTGYDKDAIIKLDFTSTTDSEDCKTGNYYSCKTYQITNDTNNILVYVYSFFDEYGTQNNTNSYIDVNKPILLSTINKKIDLTLKYNGPLNDEDFAATTYDEEALIKHLNILKENMLEDIKIDETTLTGNIDSSKKGTLFLSIPYDNHFKIYVDNKEVEYYSILNNAFIGLDIEKGKHKIKVEYVNNSYITYIISSILSIFITLLLYRFINKKVEKRHEEERKELERLEEIKSKRKSKKNKKRK